MNPGKRKWRHGPFKIRFWRDRLNLTPKNRGREREKGDSAPASETVWKLVPSVIYEVRPKPFHNILNEADELRVTTSGMKSEDGFLRTIVYNSLGKGCFHHLCANEFGRKVLPRRPSGSICLIPFWETDWSRWREWFFNASSCATGRISVHWRTSSLYNSESSNENSEEDTFCLLFSKPAKCRDVVEIYYSKDFWVKAPALKALPPTTWKLCHSKKIPMSKIPRRGDALI